MLPHAPEAGEDQGHGSAPSHGGEEEGAGACVKDRPPGAALRYTYFMVMNSLREFTWCC